MTEVAVVDVLAAPILAVATTAMKRKAPSSVMAKLGVFSGLPGGRGAMRQSCLSTGVNWYSFPPFAKSLGFDPGALILAL
jgi:hypothetical protein